jgi:conjugal transfer pilus assembly protein TraW
MQATPPDVAACRDLGQLCGADTAAAALAAGQPTTQGVIYTVFVTRALGTEALRAIFREAAGADVRIVFRGVAPGERLMDAIRAIHALLDGIDPLPNVELDPTPFRDHAVETAPVIVAAGPDGVVARVTGLSAPDWLRQHIRTGAHGDLGVRGPLVAISEPDLIEELQRRLAALDLGALREAANKRYWHRAAFEALPTVRETRERTIEPTITASADLVLPDGTKLIQAGQTVNPLAHLPFTQRLIVFDAADPGQVLTAQRLGETAGPRPLYLASGLDRAQGWEGLRAVEDRLDAPVYLLTPDVRARFALERVPALVEAQGRVFLVREVPPERGPEAR